MASARGRGHDQRENLWIGRKRRAIWVIGREENPPWIVDSQEQFQSTGPLHGIDEIVLAIKIGNDAAAVAIAVVDHGFFWPRRFGAIELAQYIGRDGDRLPEHDLANIDSDIRRGVDGRGELGGGGRKAVATFGSVRVELQMREVQAFAPRGLNRREGGRDVAGNAEIIGVQMQGVRDFEILHRPLQGLDDLARG